MAGRRRELARGDWSFEKDGFPLEIVRENPKYGGTSGGRTLFQSHGMEAEFVAKINHHLRKYGSGVGHKQLGQKKG